MASGECDDAFACVRRPCSVFTDYRPSKLSGLLSRAAAVSEGTRRRRQRPLRSPLAPQEHTCLPSFSLFPFSGSAAPSHPGKGEGEFCSPFSLPPFSGLLSLFAVKVCCGKGPPPPPPKCARPPGNAASERSPFPSPVWKLPFLYASPPLSHPRRDSSPFFPFSLMLCEGK